jgi:prolyl-tRNA editing enzyme YbaK/EbsC (Cys-tRNA(Pro) deacylase)
MGSRNRCGTLRAGEDTPQAVLWSFIMSKRTRATAALEASGVAFTVHSYADDPDAERAGLQAAEALGEDLRRVLKTLMAEALVHVNAGQRGLQARLDPRDMQRALGAVGAPLVA